MRRLLDISIMAMLLVLLPTGCSRQPMLHLHRGEPAVIEMPTVDLDLEVFWDYEFEYGVAYDWKAEWTYGWDLEDSLQFGVIGYVQPKVFNLRRYYTAFTPLSHHTSVRADMIRDSVFHGEFDYGYWDVLVWNEAETPDGVLSTNFDEESSLDAVTAYTNQSMTLSSYQAPRYTHAFYQPEQLFSAYMQGVFISPDMEGFEFDAQRNVWVKKLNMTLQPVTYIYLTQLLLHNNMGRVSGVDGSANMSGMTRSVNVNTGRTSSDAVTVNYNVLFKKNCVVKKTSEVVDAVGGKLLTFGMCNMDPGRVTVESRASDRYVVHDVLPHYLDLKLQFNNGMDSTLVFDVTDQVRKLYKGGVITVELDMDTVPIPRRAGGSAFDATVLDYEDGGTHEFDM